MPSSQITPADVVVLFADLQAGIADLPGLTVPYPRLQKGVLALARLCRLFAMPAFVSAVKGQDGGDAHLLPEINQGLRETAPVHYRTTADSFANEAIREAIVATGRHTLLIAGVATEIAVQLPALSGSDHGFRTFVVVDAVAGLSHRTEEAAFRRMAQAGASTVSIATLAGELAGDFAQPTAQEAIQILFEMAQKGDAGGNDAVGQPNP